MTRLPGGSVGLLSVSHTASAAAAPQTKRFTLFNVIFDNSASMGDMTRLGLEAVVRPLLQRQWFTATAITLFHESAKSFPIADEAEFNELMRKLPPQSNTNITVGVQHGMKHAEAIVRSRPVEEEVHVLTMMLTDGMHNCGPALTAAGASAMRDSLQRCRAAKDERLHHTVLIFCLTDNSDATASMIIKEVFETAKVPGLPNIFYARAADDMVVHLNDVVSTCGSIFDAQQQGSLFANLALRGGTEFIATGKPTATHHFMPHHTETFVVTLGAYSNWLTVNGESVLVVEIPVGSDVTAMALAAVRDALQPLTRQAIAFSVQAIEQRLASLEVLIAAIDEVAASEKAKKGGNAADVARTPMERRAMLKRVISTQYGLHEIRNALAALRVRSRSNSDSISLLTGNQRKFAHVASKRSGTESRTPQMVAKDTITLGQAMLDLIRQDTADDTRPRREQPLTAVTLQTNEELLSQWVDPYDDVVAVPTPTNDEGIMDVLSAYGIAAYPVRLVTCDASQVDFAQLKVAEICTQLADSASMMMSWRMNQPIKFADGNTYTELLLLVDPALPRTTTRVLSKSMLVQHLLSAMISKDLYMYLPPMHSAMHTHSFALAVTKAIALGQAAGGGGVPLGSFLRLALHIVYSARKLMEQRVVFEDTMDSFNRWLLDLKSVTRSPADDVHHVLTLSLKLAISTFDIDEVDDRTALLNQFNEHLARRLAAVTSKYAAPAAFAQQLFSILPQDAPQVSTDDLEPERDELLVRQGCRKHVAPDALDGTGPALAALGHATVQQFVESEWLDLFNIHQFSLCLHAALRDCGITMDAFCECMERAAGIPDWLVEAVQARLAAAGTDVGAMWAFLGVDAKHVRDVCAASVMQACLFPGSAERCGVVQGKDVTDPTEQRLMIEELYMLHYRIACGLKGARRYAVIGEVTAMQAASADVDTFTGMIGAHTHGHSRRVFWGMLRGLLADASEQRKQQKLDVFYSKSSKTGFDAVVKRARRSRDY